MNVAFHVLPDGSDASTARPVTVPPTTVRSVSLKFTGTSLNVNVTTFKGQVQLSGYVDNANQRTKAEQIARKIEGVKSVSNDLIVKAQ